MSSNAIDAIVANFGEDKLRVYAEDAVLEGVVDAIKSMVDFRMTYRTTYQYTTALLILVLIR